MSCTGGRTVTASGWADLLPATIAEMGRRAARPDFDRWAAQVQGCGHCSRPIRLRGSSDHPHRGRAAGRRLRQPHRAGRRRLHPLRQPPRRGVPVLLARVPGRHVAPPLRRHRRRHQRRPRHRRGRTRWTSSPSPRRRSAGCTPPAAPAEPCHPRRGRQATFCPHGRPEHCPRVHRDDDPDLGTPLCPDCYDYAGQVAFNWHAPELWRRFTITLRRRLADRLGIPRTQLREYVTVNFAKVAEFQRRGVVHFHALIRLDGPGDGYPPPAVAGHRRAAGRRRSRPRPPRRT